ncbi:hypothetical protein Tco_1281047 [Tanacetum coccineum]
MTLKKTVRKGRKPQATSNYAAKYNYASAQTNNIEDEEEKEEEAAFNICSNLSVQKSPFADIFIKGLPSALFEEFRTSLSVQCPPAPTAGEC